MDLNVLEYVQRTESKGGIPKYEKLGMNTEGHKLPPKPELTPDRLDKLFSKLDFSGMEEWPEDVQQPSGGYLKNIITFLCSLTSNWDAHLKSNMRSSWIMKQHLKIVTVVSLPINIKKSENIYKTCWT